MSDSQRARGGGRGRGGGGDRGGYQGGYQGQSPASGGRDGAQGSDRGSQRASLRGRGRGGFDGQSDCGRGASRGRGGYSGGHTPNPERDIWKPDNTVPKPDATITSLEDQFIQGQSSSVASLSTQIGKLSVGSSSGNATTTGAISFPRRPAYGNGGKNIVLWANYFQVKAKPQPIFKYALEVKRVLPQQDATVIKGKMKDKSKDPTEVKGRILKAVVELALKDLDSSSILATEYKSRLISLKPLDLPAGSILTVQCSELSKSRTYEVKFNGPTLTDLEVLNGYLKFMQDPTDLNDQIFPKFADTIDALNVILGHTCRSSADVAAIGKGRLFPTNNQSEVQALGFDSPKLIIRGYFQSLRPATGRLLLNANVTHGIFRRPGNIGEFIHEMGLAKMDKLSSMKPGERQGYFGKLKHLSKVLSKARIRCEIRDHSNKARVVEKTAGGLASIADRNSRDAHPVKFVQGCFFAGPQQVTFYFTPPPGQISWVGKPLPSNQYCTVGEYHERRYGRRLDPSLPLINVGASKKPAYFPAEGCDILQGQAIKSKLTANEAQDVIRFACRSPFRNAESITSMGRSVLALDSNTLLEKFGISVDKNLITVHGRVLPSPAVMYSKDKGTGTTTVNSADGQWNMRNVNVARKGRLINRWTWFYIIKNGYHGRPNDIVEVQSAVKAFTEFMVNNMGINMVARPGHPDGVIIRTQDGSETQDIRAKLEELKAKNMLPEYAVVVVPDSKDANVYNSVKYLADVDFGFHTTCTVRRNLVQKRGVQYNLQYFANVALKFNLKTGGVNHTLRNELDIIKGGKTMVVGWDVIHPTNLSINAHDLPSQVGLVSSIDKYLAQWPAISWNQASRQEMLDAKLKDAFKSRLQLWQNQNRGLPENIIIFRDGVSEGQFSQVITDELAKLREACKETYTMPGLKQPRFSIIVSVKRHQTWFYPTSEDANDRTRSNNIKNGTVVDRGVTLARYWDFFLTAHNALQGTAKPARYTVVHDEIFVPKYGAKAADELEKLTHELCYLFGRATKAVSICPPAYYADIVCTRARIHMGDVFEQSEVATVSTTSEQSGPSPAMAAAMQRKVHPNIANDMYYI